MDPIKTLQRIKCHPLAGQLAPDVLIDASRCEDEVDFLNKVLSGIAGAAHADFAAVARPEQGVWKLLSRSGQPRDVDPMLLADVLDGDVAIHRNDWAAAPLDKRSPTGEILALHAPGGVGVGDRQQAVDALAALLGTGLRSVRARQHGQQRVHRLEAILKVAGQWNQNLEMESLLTQMAETSTQLLDAERASIFLWDRPNKTLVGRPALGVDGNELRIPDSSGIVGQVVHTGDLRRVDENRDQETIDRHVDDELGFRTSTLLCAPLRSRDGKVLGAFEMINKRTGNFTADDEAGLVELASHAAIALENTQHLQQLLESRRQITQQAAEGVQLIGETPGIQRLRDAIRRVAVTDLALLVLGENGTGKEVVSQMVHYLSPRRAEPFVAVNCAALTETLLESELFGHEKGAFTDAHEARAGKFELASGGTLFLDEIGDLSPSGQAKLLRVLEEKVVVRVGGSIPIATDTRVIAATNQNLAEMVYQRQFREDLFFRLNVVTLEVPPLRERIDDILLLADHFLNDFCRRARRPKPMITAEAAKRMRQHHWPGNVRELRNLMERLAYLTPGEKVDRDDLAFILSPERDSASGISLDMTLADATHEFQSDYIRRQVEASGGNMSDAARRMGLHRSNLYRKMRQLEMGEPPDSPD